MKRALDNKYNVIIDGTMKNHTLAEKQIYQLEKAGYNIETGIYTCSKKTSWSDVNERNVKSGTNSSLCSKRIS